MTRLLVVVMALGAASTACASDGGSNEVASAKATSGTEETATSMADETATSMADETATTMADETATTSDPAMDETTEPQPEQLADAATDAGGAVGDASADVVGCSRIDDETIELELVNSSADLASYWLTVGYFDEADQRVADSSEYLGNIRPGERTIESVYVFETAGSNCEILSADRTPDLVDPADAEDVSACQITGTDSFGDVEATVSATNGSEVTSDYSVTVAFVDGEGVRRGTGDAYIEVVRPGETAPSDVFTMVDSRSDFTCDVVAVIRSAS